jgi:hypothetical protein
VDIAGTKRGAYYDHELLRGGGMWELLEHRGYIGKDATDWLRDNGISIRSRFNIVAEYDYRDEKRNLLFQVVRLEPKDFRQRKPNGHGGWDWSIKGVRRVPYRLPELLAADRDATIYLVEGEKDAERAAKIGLISTCNAGGASSAKGGKSRKWSPEITAHFAGRDVVSIPDNDPAGLAHAKYVAGEITRAGGRVRIIELPGLPAKGDFSDFLDAGGTRQDLEKLAAEAPLFTIDRRHEEDDAEIERLATLSEADFDRERAAAVERLGIRPGTLDRLVKAARSAGGTASAAGQGRPVAISDVEPWPEPIIYLAVLLDELRTAICKYVIISFEQATAIVVWCVFTYAFDLFDTAAKLVLTSPTPRCGKTRLMQLLDRVVRKSLFRSGLTPASMARIVENIAPSILLDEIDRQIRKSKENAEALTQLLNAGFDRAGAVITLMVQPPGGGEKEPRDFSVWGPQVLAGIGKSLHETVRDRSITIAMQRKRRDKKVARLRRKDGGELTTIARKLARWVEDNTISLGAAEVEMPTWLDDRACDAWEPLFVIGKLAGEDWFKQVRDAARVLSGNRDEIDIEDEGLQLLSDIREVTVTKKSVIGGREEKGISSEALVRELITLDESLWRTIGRNRLPLTKRMLADRLRPFGISPQRLQFEGRGSRIFRGYRLTALERIFGQYLPTLEVDESPPKQGQNKKRGYHPPQKVSNRQTARS